MEYLGAHGQEEMGLRLLAMITVVDTLYLAWATVYEDKKVSFTTNIHSDAEANKEDNCEDDSSDGMSSRSRESTSMDHSSRETSPEVSMRHKVDKSPAASILKKQSYFLVDDTADPKSNDVSTQKASTSKVKKGVRLCGIQSPTAADDAGSSEIFSTSTPRTKGRGGGVIKFMNNDPYTSNPESCDESEV